MTIYDKSFFYIWTPQKETSPYGDEPELCLCLPESMAARQALGSGHFRHSIEAGLGDSHETFMQFGVHTFPGIIDPTTLGGDHRQGVLM